jgi:hypothetical protein
MRRKCVGFTLFEWCVSWTLLLGAAALGAARVAPGAAQTTPAAQVATPLVADTIYDAEGTGESGTLLIAWPAFVTAGGANIAAGSTSVTLGAGGALSVSLVPNAGSVPMGSYYTVIYHLGDGSTTRQYWVVPVLPPGGAPSVKVGAISASVLPASVAMQTVTKAYVDQAIAAAATGAPLDASPYVLKAGDTMTGPLVLPGDPVAPLQAAEKQYVDEQIAGVGGGVGQKVSTQPQTSQVVVQPVGTDLAVNNLNGDEYASQYVTGNGNNGIANALAGADCVSGCDIIAEHSYASNEAVNGSRLNSATRVEDRRNGGFTATSLNPLNTLNPGDNSANELNLTSTRSGQSLFALNGAGEQFSTTLKLNNSALAGGVNVFPQDVQGTVPYFKTTYSALIANGVSNTPGQHVLASTNQTCYSVGDCLMGAQYMLTSGGLRDDADEGAHPFDLNFQEDPAIFEGTCSGGCTPGSAVLTIAPTANNGTQGEGRYLIVTTPSKVITSGTLVGGGSGPLLQSATFAGTNFPVSVFLETAQTIPSQANAIAPGTVTVPIVTSSAPSGYSTNTAALPATTGVACIAGVSAQLHSVIDFETANYKVLDGSHLQLTLTRPHQSGATIGIGGLCGYGIEQTVDTVNGIRQVFPVVGSPSATTLEYASGSSPLIGISSLTSAYINLNLVVAAISRTNNVVTITTTGQLAEDVNGLTLQVQGVADSSYNGSFVMTTTASNMLTYAQAGPNSTSAGGTISLLTGGFALYPMTEVTSVYNGATRSVDGQMTLAPNTIQWANGDTVEEPHYFQQKLSADTQLFTQWMPRPALAQTAGIFYAGNNGPGLTGWTINNATSSSYYFGQGGTHGVPVSGIQVGGVWSNALEVEAGTGSVLYAHCNLHGCGNWNSTYNLLQMDSLVGLDKVYYQPQLSRLTINLSGSEYNFSPQAFTAGTINATRVNAQTITGLFQGNVAASALPVFGASGSAHQVGAVPDPGATAGASRFLREDGAWATPGASSATSGAGSNSAPVVTSASGYSTAAPAGLPARATLLGEYLLTEGTGTVAHDTSGSGNDGTIVGTPTWEAATDLDFNGNGNQYISVPPALNATQTWQFAVYNPPFGYNVGANAPVYQNFGNPSLLCGTTTGQLCMIQNSMIAFKSHRFFALTDNTESAETLPDGWHIVTVLCGSNVAGVVTKTHYLFDGQEVGSYISQGDANTCPNAGTAAADGNYQIGGSSLHTETWWTGKIAAAWAWSTALTVQQGSQAAQAALAYLRLKGAPSGYRPVTSQVPLIVAGLDSRTFGIQLTPTTVWPAVMQLTDSSYARVNLGVPGHTAFDACTMFDLTYGMEIGVNEAPVITMIWGGVNDFNHRTARQVADSLRCMVQKAKRLGSRVVLATEISAFSSDTRYDTEKDALDLLLRAEAYGWGVDNLAELATDPHIGPDGASSNTTCFPDGVHLSAACEPYVTSVMQNAANELIGSTPSARSQNAAATYQEVAGDRFLDLTGASAQTVSLPDCIGYSLPREINNLGPASATVAPVNGETLTGLTAIAPGARAAFIAIPGAPAAGGCRWERTQ